MDDVGRCVFTLPFTEVIKSCWRQAPLTPKTTCFPIYIKKIYALTFLTLACLFLRTSHLLWLLSPPPPSLCHYIFHFSCLFLHFTSFFPAPSTTPLVHSLRKSHSLIWDMLDLVSLKATLLTPCLPVYSAGYLKLFHHSSALSVGMLLFYYLYPPNANPLPESPSFFCVPLLLFD